MNSYHCKCCCMDAFYTASRCTTPLWRPLRAANRRRPKNPGFWREITPLRGAFGKNRLLFGPPLTRSRRGSGSRGIHAARPGVCFPLSVIYAIASTCHHQIDNDNDQNRARGLANPRHRLAVGQVQQAGGAEYAAQAYLFFVGDAADYRGITSQWVRL